MAKVKATANKIEKRVFNPENKSLDIINYDFDNHYPQRVKDIVNDSGTAKTCLRLFSRFVMGGGAKDETFYKSRVNSKGLTVDKFLRKLIDSKGHFDGVAVHVNYNGLRQKTELTPIPFEFCRLVPQESKDNAGKIALYDDWGLVKKKSIKRSDIDFINVYNPNTVLSEVEEAGGWDNYKGQVFYWTPTGHEYPLAPFDAVLEDMITESQVKRFKTNTSAKNFLASHILITGKAESVIDEKGNEINKGDDLAGNLKEFQGGDGAGQILWLERENNDENIELQKVDTQDYDGLYEYTENSSRDNIIKSFLIPPVLLLRVEGSLGTSKEIADATDYYNAITADDRLQLEEILRELFTDFAYQVCPSEDYSIIPLKYTKPIDPEYFSYYTKNEIRVSNGDPEANDVKADIQLLAVTLGVGGTQALQNILVDQTLTIDQKKGSLKTLFGLTDDQANEMLGIKL
jgi:hypothetical protein